MSTENEGGKHNRNLTPNAGWDEVDVLMGFNELNELDIKLCSTLNKRLLILSFYLQMNLV